MRSSSSRPSLQSAPRRPAWIVCTKAKAAGVIHTDFERGFICAETISSADYIALGGEVAAKAQGKMRLEGKEYVTQDGDVFHFRFNALG